jgi:hypothetical protein
MPPAERLLLRSLPWLVAGSVAAVPLLTVSPENVEDLLTKFVLQLSALVAFGFGLTVYVARVTDESWFAATRGSVRLRSLGGVAATIVIVTFTVTLVTLASSAALRYDPSLQFLQLLSAMDISWVVAAVFLGARMRWGDVAAWVGGIVIGAMCVWSIWRYLDTVGFSEDGGWLVSAPELLRLVILFDTIAAAIAIAVLLLGVGARHPTAQRKPQS